MSRLRRMVLSDRFFFVTCRLSHKRAPLSTLEFAAFADAFESRHKTFGFLLTAWVFLPNHWHAILFPKHPLTVSNAMNSVKTSSTRQINRMRGESGVLWQGRFFDRALRTVKEYGETVDYIHWNPVKAGLANCPEEWPWSSALDYAGHANGSKRILTIDPVDLPADERARI